MKLKKRFLAIICTVMSRGSYNIHLQSIMLPVAKELQLRKK